MLRPSSGPWAARAAAAALLDTPARGSDVGGVLTIGDLALIDALPTGVRAAVERYAQCGGAAGLGGGRADANARLHELRAAFDAMPARLRDAVARQARVAAAGRVGGRE